MAMIDHTKPIKKNVGFLAVQFQRLHFGTIIYAKVGVIVNLLILVKVYNMAPWVTLVCAVGGMIALWVAGYISDTTGFKDEFERKQQKVLIDTMQSLNEAQDAHE